MTVRLASVLMAAGMACFAAEVKTDGTWYNFKTTVGVDFGAGTGFAYNHSSFEPSYSNPGAPPWTFTAASGGVKLTVVDGGEIGDVYNVWDNGVLLGVTSQPQQLSGVCGELPQSCLDHPQASKGVFQLPAGAHSITISVHSSPYPDSFLSWFRIEANTGGQSALPVVTHVLSAAGGPNNVQPFVQPGSWVAIFGRDLAATTATWTGQIVDGRLPTAVGGVSVTFDGQPAFVYFVSETQINVQAPDVRTGSVDVVVRNSAGSSAPVTAEVRNFAPGFFQWGASRYAVGTRHPDYQLVGNPSMGAVYVGARRGEVLVLWGTGFGPSQPNVPPGTLPLTSAATIELPVVTVGGTPATVFGAAVSPGLAGVYQVAIQVPQNASIGDVPVEAVVGGVSTPTGVYLHIVQD